MALTHYSQKLIGIYPFPHRPFNQLPFVQLLTLAHGFAETAQQSYADV